jgi:peptidoglycan biosynthesis protein MviN/MurJ (putative lipid II flippase)
VAEDGRSASSVSVGGQAPTSRWKAPLAVVTFAVLRKGLAFIREAVVAADLGASSSADGYYLALAVPTLAYSLGALPFSMWVTARMAALAVAVMARSLVSVYAPGLDPARLHETAFLTAVCALAIPALGLQAVCNGRLWPWMVRPSRSYSAARRLRQASVSERSLQSGQSWA